MHLCKIKIDVFTLPITAQLLIYALCTELHGAKRINNIVDGEIGDALAMTVLVACDICLR